MKRLKTLFMMAVCVSLMGIGPILGKNDFGKKVDSSYNILCFKDNLLVGSGSGNHFKVRGTPFVTTAAHVVDTCDTVAVVEGNGEVYQLDLVIIDILVDWAVLKPKRPLLLPPAKFYRKSIDVGDRVDMLAWPSDYGMVYTEGMISGHRNLSIYIQTFCWLGSSGAAVFADDGAFVGLVHGIKVGWYDPAMPPQLLNGMCLVRPLTNISDIEIYEAVRSYDGGEARYLIH
jgi:S1-C subfamily serine protease